MISFAEYSEMDLVNSRMFSNNTILRNKFNEYLHLTQETFDDVSQFVTDNEFKQNYNFLGFEKNFDDCNSEEHINFKKLFDAFIKRNPKISYSKCYINQKIFYSVQFKNMSWCREKENLKLLKNL